MSDEMVMWLVRQSLLALAVGGAVWLVERSIRDRPRLFAWAWTLVLVRFVWPSDWSLWRLPEATSNWTAWPALAELGERTPMTAEVSGPVVLAAGGLGGSTLILLLWAVGSVLMMGRWLIARRGVGHWVAQASVMDSAHVTRLLSGRPVPPRVRVLVSDAASAPFALGLWRRRIVVPRALLAEPLARQRAVFSHELAHIERHDELWLWFENLICCLFFFHPVAWHAARRAALAREVLCDARAVTRSGTAPAEYARALLAAEPAAGRQPVAAFSPARRTLEHRIRAVLTPAVRRYPRLTAVMLMVGLVLLAFAAPAAVIAAPALSSPQAPALLTADPLPGARVSSSFGEHYDPTIDARHHHDGIDLVAAHGVPVRAAGDGVVHLASRDDEPNGPYGLMIVIDHGGGTTTFYAHLSAVEVKIGQRVRAGEPIGAVGRTGKATGTHLHFEVRQADTPQDPADSFPTWVKEAK